MANAWWKQYRAEVKDAKQGVDNPTSHKNDKSYKKKKYVLYVKKPVHAMTSGIWQFRMVKPKSGIILDWRSHKVGKYSKLKDVYNAVSSHKNSHWSDPQDKYFYIDKEGNEQWV